MKLRKHIVIVLSFLILVSNVGLAFNVHYCEGKVSGVSFNYKSDGSCLEKKVEQKKSCCAQKEDHDSCCKSSKVKIEKTTSDNVLVKAFQLDLAAFTTVDTWYFSHYFHAEETVLRSESPSFYCDSNAPPLYKLYSQYLFYA